MSLNVLLKMTFHFENEKQLFAETFAGGRGDSGTLRSTKSEESLTSLHNVEGNY